MTILNERKKIASLGGEKILESIEQLSDQVTEAWPAVLKLKIPRDYYQVKNIVINGMGGSGLGGHLIQSLFNDNLQVPLEVIHSYHLPASLNQDSLYIISSYSGTTEEPISTLKEALRRRAKVFGITTGRKLGKLLLEYKIPHYLISGRFNPPDEPRMGLGYSIIGQLGLLKKLDLVKFSGGELAEIVKILKKGNQNFGLGARNNEAKKLACAFKNKIPIIVGPEFLAGNLHIMANQLNETSKNFANYFVIPELNHHLMEGLQCPRTNQKNLKFLFIESDLCHPRVKTRFKVTKLVVKKNNIDFDSYRLKAKSKLLQSFELLAFGGYLSLYLSVLNKVDPARIPWVDYFKKELAKK